MKAERQYLAHFIDADFDTTYAASTYVRLGDDLEMIHLGTVANTRARQQRLM